ncbi:Type IV pilus biogenesis factor PilY1 [Halioglobus japonicus]|nr:Type IV pilus biogenesis factor PilY1 [Halioglobus japonicus]
MRRFIYVLVLLALFSVSPVRADDIEAYLYGARTQGVFVQVVMDLGDSDVDAILCTYGVDCAPPFMSEEAYHHLGELYQEGESVTAPGVFKAVLSAVLENPLLDDLYVSLLISNHQNNPTGKAESGVGGGSVLKGYRRLQSHRAQWVATLKAVPIVQASISHQMQPRETYLEWLRYLVGGEVALGQNTAGNFGSSDPNPGYDETIITDGRYLTPFIEQHTCPKLYSILFTLGEPARDGDLDTEIAAQLPGQQLNSFTQLLAYLHDGSTDLLPQLSAHVPLQTTWVVTSRDRPGDSVRYAAASGGEAVLYVDEPQALQASLTKALLTDATVKGQSMAATFAEDVFEPGQVRDTLLAPQFLPQSANGWPGNLKKLKLELSDEGENGNNQNTYAQVVDAHGLPAYELSGQNKGQLREDALTFWTDIATLPKGNGVSIPDDADGPVVARGGAGQKIDGFVDYQDAHGSDVQYFIGDTNADTPLGGYGPRQLYYAPSTGQTLLPFNADVATVDRLDSLLDPTDTLTEEQRLNLIKWARGQDVDSGSSTARSWIMGAVMHSRPFALNYGAISGYSRENPNVRVMFGSTDGVFHIVQSTQSDGRESGREVFGFYPRESLGALSLRRTDQVAGLPKHYGVDGAPVVLRVDHNADGTLDAAVGDEAYVYFGLRRGGSSYFALDISAPDAVPTLAWKLSRTVGGAFDELGLTFSTPVVGKVNYAGSPVDVLIFAGGYNGGWTDDFSARRGKDHDATDDAVGNAIYIVNARTGESVWKAVRGDTGASTNTRYYHAGLVDSIPSSVSALVTPEGIVHRLYVGDSGGAVWRVDLPPNRNSRADHRRDRWFITKLADLGADAAETGGSERDDRRFFHAPDIVQSYDAVGNFDGLLIQSGNRADPNETVVENALFYIKDREIQTGSEVVRGENDVSNPAGRYQMSDMNDQTRCIDGSEEVSEGGGTIACADRRTEGGWYIRFEQPGEKGLSTPLTDGGRVFTSTFTPGDISACSPRSGRGNLYVLELRSGAAVENNLRRYELGEGIPAEPVSVGEVIFLPGGGGDLYDLDRDGIRDTTQLLPSRASRLYRTYWREPGADPL